MFSNARSVSLRGICCTLVASALLLLGSRAAVGTPLGTAFTYQGQLMSGGSPVNGTADFRFSLWSALSAGTQVGTTLTRANVNVLNGVFMVTLDYGAPAFGEARWLQIAVRSPAGAGSYTTLSPRQPITATPYALQTRGIFVDAAGNVGVGTTSPDSALHVTQPSGLTIGVSTASGGHTALKVDLTASSNGAAKIQAVKSAGSAWGDILMNASGGNVGIGTAAPGAGLHIRKEAIPPGGTLALEGTTHTYMTFFPDGVAAGRKGYFGFASATTNDITIGNEAGGRIVLGTSSGAHFATGGEENLRLLRGTIDGAGNILQGSGFTVARWNTGWYHVTFNVPFPSAPTVTATVYSPALSARCVESYLVDLDSVTLVVLTPDHNYADATVHFIVIGPR